MSKTDLCSFHYPSCQLPTFIHNDMLLKWGSPNVGYRARVVCSHHSPSMGTWGKNMAAFPSCHACQKLPHVGSSSPLGTSWKTQKHQNGSFLLVAQSIASVQHLGCPIAESSEMVARRPCPALTFFYLVPRCTQNEPVKCELDELTAFIS